MPSMTIQILREADAPLAPLMGRTVAVLGYGNQGRAHALNLRDSGLNIVVGNREGTENWNRALVDGFDPQPLPQAASRGDLVILALPDVPLASIYTESVEPHISPSATLGILHGFSVRFGGFRPDESNGLVMVAPKGPGKTLRDRYTVGQGIPCIFALRQAANEADSQAIGLAWAAGIGCARAGILVSTVAAETETDLFGEQAVLCGGMTALILTAFQTLVDAGYPPELAYIECCHEAKQVADLVYERGLAGMAKAISDTAEFGMYDAVDRLIDDDLRGKIQAILDTVRDASFAQRMIDDLQGGSQWFSAQRDKLVHDEIERAGETVRSLMPWLGQ